MCAIQFFPILSAASNTSWTAVHQGSLGRLRHPGRHPRPISIHLTLHPEHATGDPRIGGSNGRDGAGGDGQDQLDGIGYR